MASILKVDRDPSMALKIQLSLDISVQIISIDFSSCLHTGLGQDLQPRCSNPQGIYVTEEGSAVEVCFMLFNGFVPPMITFSTEGTFNLGMYT